MHSSPFRNFLSTDFLVLPLHMPPPSLSATTPDEEIRRPDNNNKDLRPVLFPIKQPPIQVISITNSRLTDDDEEDDDEEEEGGDGEEDEEEEGEEDDDEEEEEEEEDDDENVAKILYRKRSIPSFSKSQQPSTSMTKSYAMSTSPPPSSSTVMSTSASSTSSTEQEPSKSRWLETIAQLRRSLTLSSSPRQENITDTTTTNNTPSTSSSTTTRKSNFIPMPLPPKRNVRKKRRSEATTQPRFNPETNTYTRDTRSNPDHLRMISAELNMMRHRKLSSPLKPRGFLPRRTDAFIRGQQRKLSCLKNELQ